MHLQRLLTILTRLVRTKNGPDQKRWHVHLHYVHEQSQRFYDLLTIWACGKFGSYLSADRIAAEVADFFIEWALYPGIGMALSPDRLLRFLQLKLSRRIKVLIDRQKVV